MKRLAGQAGRTLEALFHLAGTFIMTAIIVIALAAGALAYRLSTGPLQVRWLTSYLANAASGRSVEIHIGQAALEWAGFKSGAGQPLYLRLGDVSVTNADATMLATIQSAHLEFQPGAFMGSRAPIFVTSTNVHFAGSNVPVSLQARIKLNTGFKLSTADLMVTLGAGQLGPSGFDEPLSSGSFLLDVTPEKVSLTNGVLTLMPFGKSAPVVGITAGAHRDGTWHGAITLTGNSVQAGDLFHYWPTQLASITRTWVTTNILTGTASNPSFTFGLSAPLNLATVNIDTARGSFKADDVNLTWLKGVQPITALAGTLTLTDQDDIVITADTGRLGGIALRAATMHIAGVSHRDQVGTLNVPVSGSIQSAFAVLNGPNLELLKNVPAPVLAATGDMTGSVGVVLPMAKNVTMNEVHLAVDTMLRNVSVPLPVGGLSFTEGSLDVAATSQNLQIKGSAMLAGQPASVSTFVDFNPSSTPGSQPVRFEMKTIADRTSLGKFGLHLGSAMQGSVVVEVAVLTGPSSDGSLTVSADLTKAELDVPMFGWKKAAGQPGKLNFAARLNSNWSVGLGQVDSIDANAPGLAIVSQAAAGGLDLSRIRIGDTNGSGRIVPPANANSPWRFDLLADTVDVSSELNPAHKKPPAKSSLTPKPQPPSGFLWAATAHFQRLVLAPKNAPVLNDFYFGGHGRGSSVFAGTATAVINPGKTVNLAITPVAGSKPGYGESLQLDTTDGGSLLRAMGTYDKIEDGTLKLTATYGLATPITGSATMTHFSILNAPVVGKILQGITVLGIPEAASGPGLEFSELVAPFSINDHVLSLKGANAHSASLGLTASGTVDLKESTCDLDGTIVPAYALNSLPGKIPLLGKLFSPAKGGGLISMRYSMTGPLADPEVSVNPLSALTPGFLQRIFALPKALSKPAHQ